VIKKMKQATKYVDDNSYFALIVRLNGWKLKLGYCNYDNNCLFYTLDKILHNVKIDAGEMGEGGQGQGVVGSSSTGATNHDQLRNSIVHIVLQRHQTKEERQRFEEYWKESVQDWVRRMREGAFGDAVCVEYFAQHFDVNIRVYTPVCAEPLQFPMYLDDFEAHMRTVVDAPPPCPLSVYGIAHVPFEPGKEVRPNYYVPVIMNPIMKKTGVSPLSAGAMAMQKHVRLARRGKAIYHE